MPVHRRVAGDRQGALRELAADPDRRRRLGAAGREYVERHHSYAAVGEFFEGLLERVGAPTRAAS